MPKRLTVEPILEKNGYWPLQGRDSQSKYNICGYI